MDQDRHNCMSRREVLGKAVVGLAAVLLSPLFPHMRRETKREKFIRNVSNRDASYYKRLAG
ncbi:MAG: hypothetical protein ACE5JA_06910 [bacterium]